MKNRLIRSAAELSLTLLINSSLAALALSASTSAWAEVSLPVVANYEKAADPTLWKGTDREQIPTALIRQVRMPTPSQAFQAPYSEVFFQNERLVVCSDLCNGKNLALPAAVGQDYELRIDTSRETAKLRQANVYYWINRMFDHLESLGFKPSRRLIVYVDRDIDDPKNGIGNYNNAFFNDADWSLSFLREKVSPLFKLAFPGGNPAPSAGDPSVAIHEASHSVFQALIGTALNPETMGLHEAFADYLALVILDTRVVGRIMTRGHAIRDESEVKAGKSSAEAHDLGQSLVSALIEIRSRAADPSRMDRAILATMRLLARNPYAQTSDVIRESLEQISRFDIPSKGSGTTEDMKNQALEIWNKTGLLKPETVIPTDGLPARPDLTVRASLELVSEAPDSLVQDYGMPAYERITLRFHDQPINGPIIDSEPTQWQLVSVARSLDPTQPGVASEPFWALTSKNPGVVVYAASGNVGPELVAIMANARRDRGVTEGEARRFDPQGALKLVLTPGKTVTGQGPALLLDSGEKVVTQSKSRDIHRSLLAKGLGQIFGSALTQSLSLRDVGNVTLYTRPGQNEVLGYTIRYMTGLKTTVIPGGRLAQ